LDWAFAGSKGQIVRHDVDKHESEHQNHGAPNSPVSMRMLQEMVARMLVIPRFGSFALAASIVGAHSIFVKVYGRALRP